MRASASLASQSLQRKHTSQIGHAAVGQFVLLSPTAHISELNSQQAPERLDQPASRETFPWNNRAPDNRCEAERNENLLAVALSFIRQTNPDGGDEPTDSPSSAIARCFLRLANLDNGAFERANRYETALWRQVGQVLLTLDFLRRTGAR